MSPRTVTDPLLRDTPVVRADDTVEAAVRALLESDLPALPVVDERDRLLGIFGEREFLGALFPGYVKELPYAGFVPKSIESVLEKRRSCAAERVGAHMNTEHIDVPQDHSDVQLAEIFLHHRVLIVPVTDAGRVVGVVTRSEFFAELAERFLDSR
jgi:CBS domain-containing protein